MRAHPTSPAEVPVCVLFTLFGRRCRNRARPNLARRAALRPKGTFPHGLTSGSQTPLRASLKIMTSKEAARKNLLGENNGPNPPRNLSVKPVVCIVPLRRYGGLPSLAHGQSTPPRCPFLPPAATEQRSRVCPWSSEREHSDTLTLRQGGKGSNTETEGRAPCRPRRPARCREEPATKTRQYAPEAAVPHASRPAPPSAAGAQCSCIAPAC